MSDHKDELEKVCEEDGRGDVKTIIMGDWRGIVGNEPDRIITRLAQQNHRRFLLADFCRNLKGEINKTLRGP